MDKVDEFARKHQHDSAPRIGNEPPRRAIRMGRTAERNPRIAEMKAARHFFPGVVFARIEVVNQAGLRIVMAVGIGIIPRFHDIRPLIGRVGCGHAVTLAKEQQRSAGDQLHRGIIPDRRLAHFLSAEAEESQWLDRRLPLENSPRLGMNQLTLGETGRENAGIVDRRNL